MTKCCGRERFGEFCSVCGKPLPENHAPLENLVKYLRAEQDRLGYHDTYTNPDTPFEIRKAAAESREHMLATFLSWANQIERILSERAPAAPAVIKSSVFGKRA
jgi:hypothetical protein